MNQSAGQTLLSQQWASRLTVGTAYVSNWRAATHGETLFQVLFATNAENPGVNESFQTSFTTLNAPGGTVTTGFGDLVPTISLLNALGITLTGGNITWLFLEAVMHQLLQERQT